jgi:hypothetical protein
MGQRREKTMLNRGKWAIGALLLGGAGISTAAEPLDMLRYALSGGTPNLDLRLRYEDVEQDNALENADALTLRTRLGYTTAKWNGLDLMVELEDVHALGGEDYNSCAGTGSPFFGDGCNGNTTFSLVADPEDTELNQFWLRYAGIPKTVLKYGRQRLVLDNHRFIGNVGWRQNEMTYDGLSLVNTALPKLTVNYAHLTNANNIFGGDFQLTGDLLNVAWAQSERFNLTGYAYLLDFDVDVAARRDTRTYGLRATGAVPLAPVKFLYALEYASQDRHKDSPDSVDADYKLIELGAVYQAVTGKLGYEVLGGDGSYGFQTPLATLHAFQGWADVFLNTPAAGVRDAYLSLGAAVEKFSFLAVYHDFSADSGGADFGDEWDASVSRPINDNLSVMLKYADYSADSFSVDTEKLWLQAEYKF